MNMCEHNSMFRNHTMFAQSHMYATAAAEQGKQGRQQQNEQNAPEAKLIPAESFRIAMAPGD
jgi:hypothetical protein